MSNVNYPLPLTRLNPFYPGQMGVPGGWTETGLRQHCTGTVFYVDPNYPGAATGADGTDPTNPLPTITEALTKVQPQRGDVIAVMANDGWQYAPGGQGVSTDYATVISEDVVIPYTCSGVRIVGISNGPLGVVWIPATDAGWCITVHAVDVIIEGFCFDDGVRTGANGIYCEWNGITLFGENLTVRHCYFSESIDIGIQLEFSWYCDIHHNGFWNCDTYGIYTDPVGSNAAYATIHENYFYDCAVAMSLHDLDDSFIFRNYVYDTAAAGGAPGANTMIDLGTPPAAAGDGNQVFQNVLSCALGADYNTANSPGSNPAWIQNYLLNGPSVANPT